MFRGGSLFIPHPVQHLGRDRRLVLGQEAPVVLLHHVRSVLDGVTGLLIAAGLLEDMRGQHVAHVVRTMRQQAFDGAATGIGVVDPIALDDQAPGLVERRLVIARGGASLLRDCQ